MYETLLVPTDGSETVERTLPHALSLAADHDATVHALYVVDQRVVKASSGDLVEDVRTDLERQGESAVEMVADRADEAGVDARTAVRHGTPDKEIVAYAEETDADVIVIGPHGKTPRKKVEGLGSVSDRVVADASTSVLLVKDDVTDGDES
ncbi:universal stress protein [Salinirubellus sp. GCM10025818]|jgi:nucleotide-binding universal stress UspA family protein|uniref:universal stress protein n=1 Tax=Salinirubellus TaxID=2162630 RepID=UPI0030CB7AA6